MLAFKLIYSNGYDLQLGDHVFPAVKYRLVRESLLQTQLANEQDFLEPIPATAEDIKLAHTETYFEKLSRGKLSWSEILKMEIPYSQRVFDAFMLATGGTILAARRCLYDRIAINLAGGFHHAFADHGEGFCMINDLAVAIRRLQRDGLIKTTLVVDCDVHQGNGTAAIFSGDPSVFTFSIHQENNYPPKEQSHLDIGLEDKVSDAQYLKELRRGLASALQQVHADLIMYQAGADPFFQDQLGGLALTVEGLKARDRLVYEAAIERHIPIAVTLGGGYAINVQDTVRIHCNTVIAAQEVFSKG